MRRSELVGWYLEQVSDQIETEDELIERKTLVEKVIDRLIFYVSLVRNSLEIIEHSQLFILISGSSYYSIAYSWT